MNRKYTSLPFTELEVADGNFDTTRSNIDRVVIHTMDGTWEGAAARFDNPASQVSAHYGVKLDGSLIHWLEEYFTAYHSGDYPMNQRSIGIEHEDGGDFNGVRPDVLYAESAKLVKDICQFYNIPIDRTHILKHSEVSATGCPDALDIERIVSLASGMPVESNVEVDQITFNKLVHNSTVSDQINNYFQIPQNSDWSAIKAKIDQINIDRQNALNSASDLTSRLASLQAKYDEDEQALIDLNAKLTAQTISTNSELKLQKIRAVIYDKWSVFPIPQKWYWVVQFHLIKYIFERT